MEKSAILASRELVRGAARMNDLVYIISKSKALVEQDIAHTSLIALDAGRWGDCVDTTWSSTAVAIARKPAEKGVLVGEDGAVVTYVGGKSQKEKLSPAPVMIRNAREIDGFVYACGMKRQVYKRTGEKKWIAINAPAARATESKGFEDVGGYSSTEIYAVGWDGEIWQYDGTSWTARRSPTSVTLTAVCCAPDGTVYVAGQGGVLLRGRGETWTSVAWKKPVSLDLWDLAWHDGRLFVATMTGLFTLGGDKLTAVSGRRGVTPNAFSLSVHDGVLWSIGRDELWSFDGRTWAQHA